MKTEKELLEGLKRGSVEDFHEIYSIYSGRLYSFCMGYTKMEADAEDIVQDVFIRLWEYRANLRTDISVSSLLFIMSRNKIVSAYRSLVQSAKYEEYICYKQSLPEGDPCKDLHFKEYLDLVRSNVRKLSGNQKKIFILSHFEGLDNKEIAEALSLRVQTVKNQLSLATKKIREMMDYEKL